jgi:hypothetical protein
MGRAFARRYAQKLGMPAQIAQWSDAQALRRYLFSRA